MKQLVLSTTFRTVSKKISPETKQAIDLPWREIAGFRDMAIHEYLQLSLKIIWPTTHQPLTDLITKVEDYLSQALKQAA